MTSEEAYWAGLGPDDFRDEEPMKTTLTKEQRAEMRERFMLGEYTPEDVQDVFERLEAADLATAKLAKLEEELRNKNA